jgi:uncharacterized protein YvpB
MADQKQKTKEKTTSKKDQNKKKEKKPKNIPQILKRAISFVLALAILAFIPYIVEFVNIKVEENAAKPAVSSKVASSSAVSSAAASSTASGNASSAASQKSAQATTNSTQKATNKKPAVSLTSMTPVLQAPEFASGCEVSALTAVLDFYGQPMDKVTLSVLFLPKDDTSITKDGKTYRANPYKVFVGDPEKEYYGCFAPVIANTANDYLKSAGSGKKAEDITGAQPSKLYEYIAKNIPAIVWATQNMEPSTVTTTWYDRDTNKLIEWRGSEHCVVLLAYTDTTVTVCDPAKGIVNYSKQAFEERYKEMGQQAVVIQ